MTNKHQWNAALYDSRHAYVFQYGEDVLKLLAPQPGERILDLGCGTGHLTKKIADSGAQVVGLDNAASMIEQARQNYPELAFIIADASSFTVDEPFDAVFSNAALHWIPAAEQVIACVWNALKPGGRFVAEFGGKTNIQKIESAVYAALNRLGYTELRLPPYYFPSIGEYAILLEKQGFRVTFAAHFDRPTAVEGEDGIRSWLEMYLNNIVSALPDTAREPFFRQVEEQLRPTQYRDGVWYVDYVRLRIVAYKEN
jgi:trans-aconitate 2-methyltransferase